MFVANSGGGGGAVYLEASEAGFVRCSFEQNFARVGGAIYSGRQSAGTFDACWFEESSAEVFARAISFP